MPNKKNGLAPKVRTGHGVLEEAVMKEINRRRHHSREYRRRAVELLLTGKTLSELAVDLGVSRSALMKWKEEYLVEMAQEPGDVHQLSPMELNQKYQQLLKDHQKLKRQQEILKKALGIFSETLPTDMP
jgi:transposase-like protein